MKISFLGLNLSSGKVKIKDENLEELGKRFSSQKITPLFVEFIEKDFEKAEAIVVLKEKALDLLILDMEKLEERLNKSQDNFEKEALKKGLNLLENMSPLCDGEFSSQELVLLRGLLPFTLKPTLFESPDIECDALIKKIMDKAGLIIFYTGNKRETRSWLIKKGSTVIEAAGRIHSDLARGFIKAEVINFEDFKTVHNLNEARSRGLIKIVDRDYLVQDRDIIQIRFSL